MIDNKMLQNVQVLLNTQFPHKYKLLAPLGKGSFSSVYKCEDQSSNTLAIKIIELSQFSPQIIEYMENELRILQMSFENDNMIKLIDFNKTQEHIILVMEYCMFDVEYLRNNYYNTKIPDDIVISILRQVANGLSFLHQNKIIHRDLKLENIGIYLPHIKIEEFNLSDIQSARFKLLDFGLSKMLGSQENTNTFLGTPATMAPEILDDQQYSYEVDMYSLGCCLFRMVTGEFPYFEKKVSQLRKRIQSESANFDKIENSILRDLIERMLKPNTKERMTWKELYQTELFVHKMNSPISHLDISLQKNFQQYSQGFKQTSLLKQEKYQLKCDSVVKSQVSIINQKTLDQLMGQLNIYIFTTLTAYQIYQLYSQIIIKSKLNYFSIDYKFKQYIKYLYKLSKFIYQDLENTLKKQNDDQNTNLEILKNIVQQKKSILEEIQQIYQKNFKKFSLTIEAVGCFGTSIIKETSQLKFPKHEQFQEILNNPEKHVKSNKFIYNEMKIIIQNLFYQCNYQDQKEESIKQIKLQLNKCLILLAFVRAFLEKKVSCIIDSYLLEQEFCKMLNMPDALLDKLQDKLQEYKLMYD